MSRQFRDDDTSAWVEKYGDGSDGAYSSGGSATDAPIDSSCTGTSGTTSLSATNASFAADQIILIHQSRGTGAGNWELNKIASYTTGTITTSYTLQNTYASGAQVVVASKYSTFLQNSGHTLTAKAWNGTVGGIVFKLANTSITIDGSITGTGKGYRNGNPVSGATFPNYANGGEGTSGFSGTGPSATNTSGGAGGLQGSGSGGLGGGSGGGHAAIGGTGTVFDNAYLSAGGGSVGSTTLTTAVFGGGGGAGGGGSSGGGGAGGDSGIFCLLISPLITITGSVPNNGGNGAVANNVGGGGGSGGSTLVKGQSLVLGSNLLTATGGTGGNGSAFDGGAGSVGRIHADYGKTITGTTNPTIDSSQQAVLVLGGGGAYFLTNFV